MMRSSCSCKRVVALLIVCFACIVSAFAELEMHTAFYGQSEAGVDCVILFGDGVGAMMFEDDQGNLVALMGELWLDDDVYLIEDTNYEVVSGFCIMDDGLVVFQDGDSVYMEECDLDAAIEIFNQVY